ncbi:hypothetical protein ADL07_18665 [Streptomyces sp. NRRL F-4707]|nr:hypothetical protein ADL07_18665 [Streptomyces sp. NRRL F-4707]
MDRTGDPAAIRPPGPAVSTRETVRSGSVRAGPGCWAETRQPGAGRSAVTAAVHPAGGSLRGLRRGRAASVGVGGWGSGAARLRPAR